jgi:putative flippase GtrA
VDLDPDVNRQTQHVSPDWRAKARSLFAMLSRYAGVGLVVAISDYLAYGAALLFGASVLLANLLSRLVATIVGAWLHRRYTFAGPQRWDLARQMMGFAALSGVNLLISSALIHVLHHHAGLNPLWSKVGTDVVIVLISLVVSRWLIFAPAR